MRWVIAIVLLPFLSFAKDLTPIYFGFDQIFINDKGRDTLKKLAKDSDAKYIIVIGSTDSRGSRLYNLKLGEHRAANVRVTLEELGVDPDNIIHLSYGEEKTVTKNHRKNRRVDILPIYARPKKHTTLVHLGYGPHGLDKDIISANEIEVEQEYNLVAGMTYLRRHKGWVFSVSGFSNLTFLGGIGRDF